MRVAENQETTPLQTFIITVVIIGFIYLLIRMAYFDGDVSVNAGRLGRITASEILPAILGLSLFYWIFGKKKKPKIT